MPGMPDRSRPLPLPYAWRRWRAREVRYWKPGDPAPDAVIWILVLDTAEIAQIAWLGNEQWLVTVRKWCRPQDQTHAVAESERQARHWCEAWARREHDALKERFPLAFVHPNGKPKWT